MTAPCLKTLSRNRGYPLADNNIKKYHAGKIATIAATTNQKMTIEENKTHAVTFLNVIAIIRRIYIIDHLVGSVTAMRIMTSMIKVQNGMILAVTIVICIIATVIIIVIIIDIVHREIVTVVIYIVIVEMTNTMAISSRE